MAQRLIKEKDVLRTINDWWACAMMADGKPTLCAEIKALPSVETIPIDRIKQLREEMDDTMKFICKRAESEEQQVFSLSATLLIMKSIDNLIKEYEG